LSVVLILFQVIIFGTMLSALWINFGDHSALARCPNGYHKALAEIAKRLQILKVYQGAPMVTIEVLVVIVRKYLNRIVLHLRKKMTRAVLKAIVTQLPLKILPPQINPIQHYLHQHYQKELKFPALLNT
jgi:hypothetical protein